MEDPQGPCPQGAFNTAGEMKLTSVKRHQPIRPVSTAKCWLCGVSWEGCKRCGGEIRNGSKEKTELNLDCERKGRFQEIVGRRNRILGKGKDVRERPSNGVNWVCTGAP